MSGNVTYLFYAVEKPLSRAERIQIQDLSRRVDATARRADFWYDVDEYDLPVPCFDYETMNRCSPGTMMGWCGSPGKTFSDSVDGTAGPS